MATKTVMIVGVGGQGAILTSKILINGLIQKGYDVKQSEIHGMAQRGGSVSTQVIWGDKVYAPTVGKGYVDIMVAFEKMEAVRYCEFIKPDGIAIINDYEMQSQTTAAGLVEYPEGTIEAMKENFNTIVFPAADIAKELGNTKCMNVVLFGAMSRVLGLDDINWEEVIRKTVPEKLIDLNLKAFQAGLAAAEKAQA